jgi:tetratricopeptide (TPR) repeat protein
MQHAPALVAVVILSVAVAASCGKARVSGDQHATNGFQLYADGDCPGAAKELEAALREGLSEYKYEVVYSTLGNVYNDMERFEDSIRMHKKAIEINPRFHEAWVNLGIVYRLTGDFEEAEKCYATALELEPDYAELHVSLGALYVHEGKYERAVEHLEKAVELDGQLPTAWANLSLAYATVSEFEKADAALKKAIVLGYEKAPILRERIDALKALAEETGDQSNPPDAGVPE